MREDKGFIRTAAVRLEGRTRFGKYQRGKVGRPRRLDLGRRKEESRMTVGFLTWATGCCHSGNREGGESVERKEGGDSSVWNNSGLRYGWADKPEGAAHLESSTREWSEEETEQTRLPKQRVSCEQWTQNRILNPHQHFRGGQKRRRTEKVVNNNNTKRGHGSQRAEGLRKKGMVCRARCSSRVH